MAGTFKYTSCPQSNKPSLRLWSVRVCFVMLCCLFSARVYCEEQGARAPFLNVISRDERKELELFFHNLFAENELGYTLFGDKPLSFCFPQTYPPSISQRDHVFRLYVEGTIPLHKGLEVWKKAQLKESPYTLVIYENAGYPAFVMLINREALNITFHQNRDLFEKTYKSAEILLDLLENKKVCLNELFEQHVLLGIMLGYGRHNAELFENGALRPLTQEDPCLFQVTPINFAVDPLHPETSVLKKKYDALHNELTTLFMRENWIERIIDKLGVK